MATEHPEVEVDWLVAGAGAASMTGAGIRWTISSRAR